jgi:hypothetical protein
LCGDQYMMSKISFPLEAKRHFQLLGTYEITFE